MEKIAIFVDVQNIYYTVKEAYNCHFNYNTFWAKVTANREVVKAFAYAIARNDEKQLKFQQILKHIGFEIKLKPYIQRSDGSTKGDWDVGIAVDMLDYAEKVDVVALASGDGDFDLVIDKVISKYNASAEVYGVPALTATSLIKAANKFVPIERDFLLGR